MFPRRRLDGPGAARYSRSVSDTAEKPGLYDRAEATPVVKVRRRHMRRRRLSSRSAYSSSASRGQVRRSRRRRYKRAAFVAFIFFLVGFLGWAIFEVRQRQVGGTMAISPEPRAENPLESRSSNPLLKP